MQILKENKYLNILCNINKDYFFVMFMTLLKEKLNLKFKIDL